MIAPSGAVHVPFEIVSTCTASPSATHFATVPPAISSRSSAWAITHSTLRLVDIGIPHGEIIRLGPAAAARAPRRERLVDCMRGATLLDEADVEQARVQRIMRQRPQAEALEPVRGE